MRLVFAAVIPMLLGGCGVPDVVDGGDESTSEGDGDGGACEAADLERDEAHCGGCDITCADDEDCLAGQCTAETATGVDILVPERGHDRTFVMPEFRWSPVTGASEYDAVITTDPAGADILHQTSTSATSWTPPAHMGDRYWLTVTARPGGESATRPYVVRGFAPGAELASPTPVCDDPAALGTPFAYAVARAGDRLFASLGTDGGGVCVHDLETLEHILTVPGPAPNMRSYGVTTDPVGDRVFASFFPLAGMCGDTLERVLVLENASTTFTMRWANGGTEAAHTLAFDSGRLFMSGLNGVSCFDENGFCLDLGEPCTNGDAAFVGLDLDAPAFAFRTDAWASPGMVATPELVARSGLAGGIDLHDPDGTYWFTAPTSDAVRGLQRWDAEGEAFLIAGEFDAMLRVYRLKNVPPTSADDVEWINEVTVPERFWQGDHDAQGRFWFPGQASRGLYRMDITP